MLAMAQTCAVLGLEGQIVQVEVDISPEISTENSIDFQYEVGDQTIRLNSSTL
ncbi:MAG: hypothetical protein IIC41_07525 [Candidatus Marinimicrobia bacterium]|nr:hypothetical protein [Candidatus Neomarinimicrobiota bacterium]